MLLVFHRSLARPLSRQFFTAEVTGPSLKPACWLRRPSTKQSQLWLLVYASAVWPVLIRPETDLSPLTSYRFPSFYQPWLNGDSCLHPALSCQLHSLLPCLVTRWYRLVMCRSTPDLHVPQGKHGAGRLGCGKNNKKSFLSNCTWFAGRRK